MPTTATMTSSSSFQSEPTQPTGIHTHGIRTIDDDHVELQELTARLGEAPDRGALTEALEDLAHSLREYFAHEEHPQGPYGLLSTRSPEYQAETGRLVLEHRELLVDLLHLIDLANERPAPTRALIDEAASLTARLHDHERREMQLVQALA